MIYSRYIQPQPEDYVYGSYSLVFDKDINQSKNWSPFLPDFERQNFIYGDAYDCVTQSAMNCLEIECNYLLQKGLFNQEQLDFFNKNKYIVNGRFNFNDRFIAKLSGTKPGVGNDARTVALTIKKYGLIPESLWYFDKSSRDPKNTIGEYYSEVPTNCIDLGAESLKFLPIQFEWVNYTDWEKKLSQSPIQVFVKAWTQDSIGEYVNKTNSQNHAVTLYYKPFQYKILDSYDPFLKTLSPNYVFGEWGMKYSVLLIDKDVLKNKNIANANKDKLCNKNFVNALFKEKFNRDATKKEIEVFSQKTVKDACNIILRELSPFKS